MIEFLLGLAGFLILLAVIGWIADSWDARDARRRNPRRAR